MEPVDTEANNMFNFQNDRIKQLQSIIENKQRKLQASFPDNPVLKKKFTFSPDVYKGEATWVGSSLTENTNS